MAVSACSAISLARFGPDNTPIRACGAISSRIWLISLKLCASMPLVVLISSLPASCPATGCNAWRRAPEGNATNTNGQAFKVTDRSVSGSTPG
ncbi:hypothetical protein D9M68_825720 [compost metagenome]